jgi:hypothetical protein
MAETATRELIEKNTTMDRRLDHIFTNLYFELIRFQNLKDMQGVLDCIHHESLGRFNAKKILEPLFDQFTLINTITGHRYVGNDGEYIYYRFKQKIEKIAGPAFKNMCTENLVLFKPQEGEWKVWDQLVLMMKIIS